MSQKPEPGFISSRRQFLTTFALGATAAPLLSLGRSAFADSEASQASSLCYSNKRVLTSGDLQYLGAMRVPANGVRMDFSSGSLTGRVVNGRVQLLMIGNNTMNGPVYEFADTGSYHADPVQAPRMPLVRAWGDIYGGRRTSWDLMGNVYTPGGRWDPGGLFWHEGQQLLFWSYYYSYNVIGLEDWCLGASRLDPSGAVAFGPWRPAGGNKKGPWRGLRFAQHPLTGEMLCGTIMQSGNSKSPWGPDLWGGNFPTAATPAGFGAPDLPVQKYLTYYPMIGSIKSDGSFSGALRSCRRPGDYIFEPIAGGGVLTEIDPTKNGGAGAWTSLDMWGSVTWLDLPTAHGVLFTAKLGAGHLWYSNAGVGNLNCTHGMPPPYAITGPVSTGGYPALFFYDPADLDAVRSGARVDYTVDPTEVVNAEARYGIRTAGINVMGGAKSIVGSYYEPASRRLYIAAPEAEQTIPGLYNPLVHVFQVM